MGGGFAMWLSWWRVRVEGLGGCLEVGRVRLSRQFSSELTSPGLISENASIVDPGSRYQD